MERENLGSRLPLINIKNDYCFSNVIICTIFAQKKKIYIYIYICIYSDEKLINTLKLDKTSVLYKNISPTKRYKVKNTNK